MPIGKLGYMSVFSILVATYINEISTSLYLVGPGSEVSSVIMLQLWLHGFMDLLFALASFQALMVFLIIYIILGVLRIEPSISVGVRV
jgi:ABC-type Fe3+ transport system permease subunit